jgi:ABC-type multidrug transport system ATPase subunit
LLTRPTSGEVRWFGRPAGADPAARRVLGMVPHQSCLYPHLTARENVLFAARMQGLADPGRRADEWLAAAGLGPHAHRLATHLSRGTRQRLALARALVHDPPIVLMDEPFAGLDAEAAGWLLDLLAAFRRRGRAVCLATHDPEKLQNLCGRVLQLRGGRIEPVESRLLGLMEVGPGAARAA